MAAKKSKIRKSQVVMILARLVFAGLAYRNIIHPKGIILPPGAGKSAFVGAKNAWKLSRNWVKKNSRRITINSSTTCR